MARRPEALHLTVPVDKNNVPIEASKLRGEARATIASARNIFRPSGFSTSKSAERWGREENARIERELGAWSARLADNMLLAQEVYTELWEHHMLSELAAGKDEKQVFKLRRHKEITNHPERPVRDTRNAEQLTEAVHDFLLMGIARHAIQSKNPSDKSKDADAMTERLFRRAVDGIREWRNQAEMEMYVRLYEKVANEHFPPIS